MKINYEFRTNKIRYGSPNLLESPERQYTYRSLYGYDPEVTSMIKGNGHTRGLKSHPVYSDMIIIDCDTADEAVIVEKRLVELNIAFELWNTGNRGCHFHIDIEPMYGKDTIWSQICWLKEIGVWDAIDTSIYREGGQIRVPGAIHEKTGRKKEIVKTVVGEKPSIRIMVAPPIAPIRIDTKEGTQASKEEYQRNLRYYRSEGSRHMHMYILWKRGLEAGYDVDVIRDDIRRWNDERAEPPHDARMVEMKLQSFR